MATQTRRRRTTVIEQPTIDFLILADRAEGIDGKLYMMGGGWQEIHVQNFEQPVHFSLAVGVLVPWNSTNEEHQLVVDIETQDGTKLPPGVSVRINVGRPAHALPGQEFRTIIAVNGAWKLPGPGIYRVIGSVDSGEAKRASFRANALTLLTPAKE